jgi:hypothetical protein
LPTKLGRRDWFIWFAGLNNRNARLAGPDSRKTHSAPFDRHEYRNWLGFDTGLAGRSGFDSRNNIIDDGFG